MEDGKYGALSPFVPRVLNELHERPGEWIGWHGAEIAKVSIALVMLL